MFNVLCRLGSLIFCASIVSASIAAYMMVWRLRQSGSRIARPGGVFFPYPWVLIRAYRALANEQKDGFVVLWVYGFGLFAVTGLIVFMIFGSHHLTTHILNCILK